jgi:predicted MFS family arabinose efflux permease
MAVNGVALALHWPAAVGLVPQVVPPDRLQPANGLLSLAQSGAMGLGAACAGLLVATLGGAWAIAIDAGTFAVSAALVAGLYASEQQRTVPASLFQDLRDGWTEFTSHRWLWAIVLQWTVMLAAWQGSMAVVGPVVAKRLLGGPTDWGWIAGSLGAGLLAGGVLALRVRVERPMLVATLCVFLYAVPVLLLSIPAPVPMIAAGAFLAGMGGQIFGVLWFTALQTHVAPEALSRVSAYDILGSIALVPLGEAVAGPVLEAIGTGPTLWAAAALIVIPTGLVLLVPEVRTLRSRGVSPPISGGC